MTTYICMPFKITAVLVFIAAVFVPLLFSACSLTVFDPQELPNVQDTVCIVLPDVQNILGEQGGVRGASFWQLRYFDRDGTIQTKNLAVGDGSTLRAVISLQKNQLTPIIGELHVLPYSCPPAAHIPEKTLFGTIYPVYGQIISADLMQKSQIYILSEHAFISDTLWKLLSLSDGNYADRIYYLSLFNWQKAQQELSKFENHWDIDQEVLIKAIAEKKVSAKSFKKK